MEKKNKLNIALRGLTIVASILAFVALLLKFAYQKVATAMGAKTTTYTVGKWMDSIKTLESQNVKGASDMNVAKIFLFISVVLLIVTLVLVAVNFFFGKKELNYASCGTAGLTFVSIIVFLVNILNGVNNANDYFASISTLVGYKVSLGAQVGVILFVVFGFIAIASSIACSVHSTVKAKAE